MDYVERDEKIRYLRDHISEQALYEQLAEECCELGQAALKFIRVLGNGNPTPVSSIDAVRNVLEEARDVYLCMIILDISMHAEELDKKLERWYGRVKEVNDE